MAIVDSTGARSQSLDDLRRSLERRFRATFGEDIDLSPETPQGQIVGVMALMLSEGDDQVVRSSNALSIDTAQRAQLDAAASALDIRRGQESRSRVTAVLTGVAGASVPAGSRARTTDGQTFRTLSVATLSPTGVTVEMEAVDPGPVEAAANTLTRISTLVPGWEGVTNPNAASPGVAEETDAAFKQRYRARTGRLSLGPVAALRAALTEAGATRVRIVQNATSAVATEQTVTLWPHSIVCVVEGGTDTAITAAILRSKGMGVSPQTLLYGGAHSVLATLQAITAGTFSWRGENFTATDLSAITDLAGAATALQTKIRTSSNALTDQTAVTYAWPSSGRYAVVHPWRGDSEPAFDTSTSQVANALGLTPALARAQPGPFMRPVERSLTVTAAVTVDREIWPADGLQRLRQALLTRAAAFEIGERPRANDLLAQLENVPGSAVTAITVNDKDAASAVSGVTMPLFGVYTLVAADITLTITG